MVGLRASDEVRTVIAQLQAAVAQSAGRTTALGMRITELGVDLSTTMERSASGEIDLKLVKVGGGGSVRDASTVSLTMEPSDTVSASTIEDELTEALTVIEAAIAALDAEFVLTGATVEVAFEATVNGGISLVIGGAASRERSHVARVTFTPDEQ